MDLFLQAIKVGDVNFKRELLSRANYGISDDPTELTFKGCSGAGAFIVKASEVAGGLVNRNEIKIFSSGGKEIDSSVIKTVYFILFYLFPLTFEYLLLFV